MNSRIITSILSIVTVVGLATAGTLAFFSDAGTSDNNIFSTGSLDMKLTDNNETALDSVSGTFGISGGGPGTTFTGNLEIKNVGTVSANHLEFQFSNLVTEAGSPPGSVLTNYMDRVIEITALTWDRDGNATADDDLLLSVSDLNGNSIKDLDDLENQVADDIDNINFDGTQSANHLLHIAGRYHPTLMTSEHQGDTVNTTLTVTMNQDASQ
jgi:predicted ribosomally synthesized peptide with SipW-like signal peptide